MGCDIHSCAQVLDGELGVWVSVGAIFPLDEFGRRWEKRDFTEEPFQYRHYGLFGFLANVRNYAHCKPISEPRGYLYGCGYDDDFYHSASWLLLSELLDFDYDQQFWNRRVTKQTGPNSWSGAALAEEGEGEIQTYRELLGKRYFDILDILKSIGAPPEQVRVVFAFDS